MTLKKHVSLNINVRGVEPSPTLAINERCKLLEGQGERVANLGLGQSPFPVPTPVVNALRLYASEKDYLPVKGLPALKEAVAAFHRKEDGVNASPENVLVGPGSKELMFLLQLVYYGEIIVPTPAWVSYVPQAQILGKKVRLLHTTFDEKWHITPERLARFLESEQDVYRPRILVMNYPGNPDGLTYSSEELKEIASVAREYELVLLSDEIYGQLHHRGEHVSVARFYPEGTIISSGLSKWCGAGGWRLGTFTFPPDLDWLLEAMAAVASETYTSVSAPIQFAAVQAFRGGIAIERYLWHARRILSVLGSELHGILREAGRKCPRPRGGVLPLRRLLVPCRPSLMVWDNCRSRPLRPAPRRSKGGHPPGVGLRPAQKRAICPDRLRQLRRLQGPGSERDDPPPPEAPRGFHPPDLRRDDRRSPRDRQLAERIAQVAIKPVAVMIDDKTHIIYGDGIKMGGWDRGRSPKVQSLFRLFTRRPALSGRRSSRRRAWL